MSQEHKWLQNRLLVVCRHAGHEAIPEHQATDSDLYVPSASYSIEVQRWPTNWKKRTTARMDKGAQVIWLITDSMHNRSNRDEALFNYPCVSLRVYARGDRERRPIEPWNNVNDNHKAVLSVWSTVMRYDRLAAKFVSTGHVDAIAFFKEVLDGNRSWYPKSTLQQFGIGYAAWILNEDITTATEATKARRAAEQTKLNAEQARLEELRCDAQTQHQPDPPASEPEPAPSPVPITEPHPPICQASSPPLSDHIALQPAQSPQRINHQSRQHAPQPVAQRQQRSQARTTTPKQILTLAGTYTAGLLLIAFLAVAVVRCSAPSSPTPETTHSCTTLLNDPFARRNCDNR